MRQIGQIKQVQVQRTGLKHGEKPARYYDPSPILVTEQLLLTREGVIGVTATGEQVIDVHHVAHPRSGNAGMNGVSVGFTSHYQKMREQFGEHLVDGCAGENILVETAEEFGLMALGGRIAIQSQQSGALAYLENLKVAAPCVEFSQFALQMSMPGSAKDVRDTLIFLDHGRRGFYATFTGEEPFVLRAGDSVFVGA
jgi:hypothetical protein